jgi:hypothetical protein
MMVVSHDGSATTADVLWNGNVVRCRFRIRREGHAVGVNLSFSNAASKTHAADTAPKRRWMSTTTRDTELRGQHQSATELPAQRLINMSVTA